MATKYLVAIACSLSLFACENPENPSGGAADGNGGAAKSSALSRYTKASELITEAEAAELCGNPPEAEFEVSEMTGSMARYGSVSYQWPSDRMQKIQVGANEMELPKPFTMQIALPQEVDTYGDQTVIQAFDATHTPMTKEQQEAFKKGMNDALDEELKKETIDETGKAVGGAILGEVLSGAMTTKSEKVEGVGDGAYWNPKERILTVLSGNESISITADVKTEAEDCRTVAIKIAEHLLK